jgi:hypothetical protein
MFMNMLIRRGRIAMTHDLIERSGRRRQPGDVTLLLTTCALVLSLAVAITTVSIGIARAETLGAIANVGGGRFALVFFLSLMIAGACGLAAVLVRDGESL